MVSKESPETRGQCHLIGRLAAVFRSNVILYKIMLVPILVHRAAGEFYCLTPGVSGSGQSATATVAITMGEDDLNAVKMRQRYGKPLPCAPVIW